MEAKVVVNNLITLYREKKLSHAYLIETNSVSKCYYDIKKVVKGICCNSTYSEKCEKCNMCHLIDENSLPSLITIEHDGKSIKKEAIENLKNTFSKIPVYTDNNIYILKYPEKMNDTAFNKMLKFLEEPENNIIGFFITENKDNVANTIVSRCELLKINYSDNTESENLGIESSDYQHFFNLANEYSKKLDANDTSLIWYNSKVLINEITSRTEITLFLRILFNIYLEKLKNSLGSHDNLHIKLKIIAKYLEQLNYNVNTTLLLDSLVIEMGEENER